MDLVQPFVGQILVGVAADDLERTREILAGRPVAIVAGGADRSETARLLLDQAQARIVLEHEIARPFATPEQVADVIRVAATEGAAIGAVPMLVRDSVAMAKADSDLLEGPLDRDRLLLTRPPHAFRRDWLLAATARALSSESPATSSWRSLLDDGYPVRFVPAAEANVKITYPEDLALLEQVKA